MLDWRLMDEVVFGDGRSRGTSGGQVQANDDAHEAPGEARRAP
jgi:hypothetical protein